MRERLGPQLLLGGERGGLPIEGFDLGNSPLEYAAPTVAGKQIGFTTTNGTRAMIACLEADTVLLGCFPNCTAVAEQVRRQGGGVTIVCSGTNGKITLEDSLLAGAIAQSLSRNQSRNHSGKQPTFNDQAKLAMRAWCDVGVYDADDESDVEERVYAALLASQGGRNLSRLAKEDDIRFASQLDACPIVGQFDTQSQSVQRIS